METFLYIVFWLFVASGIIDGIQRHAPFAVGVIAAFVLLIFLGWFSQKIE